jgi:putative PEP-CTERM system TPR-repeat lipoprotein
VPLIARALVAADEPRKLTTTYGETRLTTPAGIAALKSTLAGAWIEMGDATKAESAIAAALAAVPDYGPALVHRARQLALKREFAPALAVLDTALARDPKLKEAWLVRGHVLSGMGTEVKPAIDSYNKALALDPRYVPAHIALVSLRFRERDGPGARAQVERLKSLLPTHPVTVLAEAKLALFEGRIDAARELSQQLMRMAPNQAPVLLLAGAVQSRSRELIQAETNLNKALQINPDLVPARLGLAEVYSALGQPARALDTLKPMLAGAYVMSEALTLAGQAELARGNTGAAEAYFLRGAKIAPEDASIKTALALTQLSRGDANAAFAALGTIAAESKGIVAEQATFSMRMKRREYDAALTAVEQMARKYPDNPSVADMRGMVQLARQDYPAARAAFEQVLKLDPGRFSAVTNLAALDLIDRKSEAAGKRLEAALKADPRNVYAAIALAELREKTGSSLDDLRKILSDAIAASPQSPEPRLQLITLTLRKRLFKDALQAASEAAAAMPGDPTVTDAVGRAQMEAGDVEQALKTFRRMAGTETKSGLAYARLGDIYRTLGKLDLAENALRKSLEVEPTQVLAQIALMDVLLSLNRKADALEVTRKIQRDNPTRAVGFMMEAAYQRRVKAPDAAVAAYRTGLAKTGDGELATALYLQLVQASRQPEADTFATSWLKDHPRDSQFEYQVSVAALKGDRLDQAQARLANLVRTNPDNWLALNNLAGVMLRRGVPGALEHAEKAAKLAPANAAVLDTLALAQAAEKMYPQALMTQKRAVELAPDANSIRLHLAQIAAQAGDKALARTELDRLKALGPKYSQQAEVERLLKLL